MGTGPRAAVRTDAGVAAETGVHARGAPVEVLLAAMQDIATGERRRRRDISIGNRDGVRTTIKVGTGVSTASAGQGRDTHTDKGVDATDEKTTCSRGIASPTSGWVLT